MERVNNICLTKELQVVKTDTAERLKCARFLSQTLLVLHFNDVLNLRNIQGVSVKSVQTLEVSSTQQINTQSSYEQRPRVTGLTPT